MDGEFYFRHLHDSLEQAAHDIFIAGWWVTPEYYLKRPKDQFPESRIDALLLKAAEKGVKVNIIVYNEPATFLYNASLHLKTYLEGLHSNIKVSRHPR